MSTLLEQAQRREMWVVLSQLYLDTQLGEAELKYIAGKIKDSPYSLKEVRSIDRLEVFPVLQKNLYSIAGEWTGFDEKWLVDEIMNARTERTLWSNVVNAVSYWMSGKGREQYWPTIEQWYHVL
ncbi:hypothetical protein BFP72_08445 [Reichenbachiella sp. 5M10]|uniref:DUF7079 family protein n=1 Tax=Reichenbachiella sp. 5M10 TaxID=1889772 RepID=UPI000C14C1BC|nr:hypothetical protein [Reichenbachiella sp. 5M10]PIB35422.1 hypothetical protein BFP72_08445 [Reichenbachiella sp. 5M10]